MTKAEKERLRVEYRRLLGVPDWFICSGCSGPAFDTVWTRPCCDRHDWDYWIGSGLQAATFARGAADKALRYNINFLSEYSAKSWWDKLGWRRPWGRVFHWAVKNFGHRSWTVRRDDQMDEIRHSMEWDRDLTYVQVLAYSEGRYDERGGKFDVVGAIRKLRDNG